MGWSESTIAKLLKNEKYIGKLVWRKTTNKKDPATGKLKKMATDPETWITADHPEMKIVSEKLWQAVSARREELRRKFQ